MLFTDFYIFLFTEKSTVFATLFGYQGTYDRGNQTTSAGDKSTVWDSLANCDDPTTAPATNSGGQSSSGDGS
jgi:hypothetical protein